MSVLTSTCQEINQSLTNNSQSKQLWSFSKADRFPKIQTYTDNIVFPSISSKFNFEQGASIGYGERSNYWLKHRKNKADKFYDLPSDFVKDKKVNNSGSPCFSFGRKPLNVLKLCDKNVKFNYKPGFPGPGDYNILTLNNAPNFSLKGRNFFNKKITKIPAPGIYDVLREVNSTGKYVKSNKSNLKHTIFGSQREKRFSDIIKQETTPGPGNYNINNGLGHNADKLKTFRSRSSSDLKFKNSHLEITPGPGQYKLPSEFGYYVSKRTLLDPLKKK